MFYQIGSSNWNMKIDDKTNMVSRDYISIWAEKYHKEFEDWVNGDTCTADFIDKNNNNICLFVKMINNIITINPMVFNFKDGPREITNYIEV